MYFSKISVIPIKNIKERGKNANLVKMISAYKLFTTPTCPSCPRVKEHMKTVKLKGEIIDAASDNGAREAAKFGITSVPTVIFLDNKNNAVEEAHSIEEVKRVLA